MTLEITNGGFAVDLSLLFGMKVNGVLSLVPWQTTDVWNYTVTNGDEDHFTIIITSDKPKTGTEQVIFSVMFLTKSNI